MPEISARDLRRLEALEGRLAKEQGERKALAAERRELRAAVAANARQARAAEKQAARAERQLEEVLAENAALAARLDEARADLERLQKASLELRSGLETAQDDLAGARESLTGVQKDLEAATTDRDDLAATLKLANDQLAGKEITPVLPAKDVAKIVDSFVSELGGGLPGMVVRDGEVRLQVAFGKVGQTSGLVVPSAESPPEVRKNLHEVAIRFDRALEFPG